MKQQLRWKVFYGDGSTFTDEDGPPELAPKRNVQAVGQECHDHGSVICRCDDFYIWAEFDGRYQWQGVDYFGLWDYLIDPGSKVVLFGRTIGNREFKALTGKIYDDPYLPGKSGYYAGERK